MNNTIDWENYETIFPTRYTNKSKFDSILEKFITNNEVKTVLEIGGGIGSSVLRESNLDVYLLDPYVNAQDWMKGKVDWDTKLRFDLVVLRGSINYLTKDEICAIHNLGKNFLANSFYMPPSKNWSRRCYITKNGSVGTERFRLNGNIIEHELIPTKTKDMERIKHSFYFYYLSEFDEMIPNLEVKHYGRNSVLLTYTKKEKENE